MKFDKQAAFTTIMTKLRIQGERSVIEVENDSLNAKVVCRYRGMNGMCCAIGHLIPDERYDPKMEGEPASFSIVRNVLSDLYGEIDQDTSEFLCDVQDAHDYHFGTLAQFERRMKVLALRYSLQYEPPSQ